MGGGGRDEDGERREREWNFGEAKQLLLSIIVGHDDRALPPHSFDRSMWTFYVQIAHDCVRLTTESPESILPRFDTLNFSSAIEHNIAEYIFLNIKKKNINFY